MRIGSSGRTAAVIALFAGGAALAATSTSAAAVATTDDYKLVNGGRCMSTYYATVRTVDCRTGVGADSPFHLVRLADGASVEFVDVRNGHCLGVVATSDGSYGASITVPCSGIGSGNARFTVLSGPRGLMLRHDVSSSRSVCLETGDPAAPTRVEAVPCTSPTGAPAAGWSLMAFAES
jgi:hypothetical protein